MKFIVVIMLLLVTPIVHAENKNLTDFGTVAQISLPITAGVIALVKGDEKGFFQLAEGTIYTTTVIHTLKWAINEERPDHSGNNSFPSGHTAAAVDGAAFLQFRYGWKYGLPAYALSAVVGYSRIQAHKHYLHDVIAGELLATSIHYIITDMGYSMTNVFFLPYINGKGVGIYMSKGF
ncbi:PAP2 family protein [Photobacterium phosphoreum]|nr:phosphatase PAP2 family protein [Photobacterium phosphoreum]PSW32777.1 PAP2 family protein [Photobacterium phosphoreum]